MSEWRSDVNVGKKAILRSVKDRGKGVKGRWNVLNVAGDALKGDEKALKFNEEALKSDSNALNDDGDVLRRDLGALMSGGRH